jgi:hypothetical protein
MSASHYDSAKERAKEIKNCLHADGTYAEDGMIFCNNCDCFLDDK